MKIAEVNIGDVTMVHGSTSVDRGVLSSVASPVVLKSDECFVVSQLLNRIGVSCEGVVTISEAIDSLDTHLGSSTETTIEYLVTDADKMVYVPADVLETAGDVVESVDTSSCVCFV